jgi:hypothetical protein
MLWYKKLRPFKLYEYYPLCAVGNTFVDMQIDNDKKAIIRVIVDKKILYWRWDGSCFNDNIDSMNNNIEVLTLLTALLMANVTIEVFLSVFAENGGILYIENMHLLSALYNYRTYRDGIQGQANSATCGKVWAYYNKIKKRTNSKK